MKNTSEDRENAGLPLVAPLSGAGSRLSRAIVIFIYIVLIFSTLIYGAVDSGALSILAVLSAIIIVLWSVDAWSGKRIRFSSSILQLPVLGLIAIGLIQLLPLGDAGSARELLNAVPSSALTLDPHSTRFFVIRLLVCLIFFAASLTFINSHRRIRSTVIVIVVFGSIMAFFGILQFLAKPDAIYGLRPSPQAIPFGSYVNQHHFAALMAMICGLTLGLLFGLKKAREKKLLLAIASVLMGISIILTGSRGGMLSFIGVIGFVFLMNALRKDVLATNEVFRPKLRIAGIAGVSVLVVIIFGSVLLLGGEESALRVIGLQNASDDVTSGRSHYWSVAARIFLDHPFIGAGLDAFGVAFTRYDPSNGALRVEQAHNDYLQILADAGIVGFACVAAFIFLLFKRGLSAIKSAGDDFRRSAAIGALAGCFGILIHSFFDFPLRTPANAFFFLILVVIATVRVSPKENLKL